MFQETDIGGDPHGIEGISRYNLEGTGDNGFAYNGNGLKDLYIMTGPSNSVYDLTEM